MDIINFILLFWHHSSPPTLTWLSCLPMQSINSLIQWPLLSTLESTLQLWKKQLSQETHLKTMSNRSPTSSLQKVSFQWYGYLLLDSHKISTTLLQWLLSSPQVSSSSFLSSFHSCSKTCNGKLWLRRFYLCLCIFRFSGSPGWLDTTASHPSTPALTWMLLFQWAQLLSGSYQCFSPSSKSLSSVVQLLSWDQVYPYNCSRPSRALWIKS